MAERKNALEGIRAIACIGVFLYHFREAFFPNEIIGFIDYTPLKIMTAGNLMVRIMFVLSGFVISYKYFVFQEYDEVIIDVVKRWFRLFPGILTANVIVCMMMKTGLLFNVEAAQMSGSHDFLETFNRFTPNLFRAIAEGAFTTYIVGGSGYMGTLWTMKYEFLGSILVLASISVFRGSYLRIVFYAVELFFFSSYYNYLIIGMLISDLYCNADSINMKLRENQRLNNVLCSASAVVICMIQINDMDKGIRVIYGIALVIFFICLLNNVCLEKALGCPKMVRTGELSFAVYIVHWPIIESFSSWYYLEGIKICGGGYKTIIALSDLFLSSILVFYVANLFNKYVISLGMLGNDFWKSKVGLTFMKKDKSTCK